MGGTNPAAGPDLPPDYVPVVSRGLSTVSVLFGEGAAQRVLSHTVPVGAVFRTRPYTGAVWFGSLQPDARFGGGGVSGQRDAVKLGLARALVAEDETVRTALRAEGLLTRDARVKERKKPGLKRARKAPTYTKR